MTKSNLSENRRLRGGGLLPAIIRSPQMAAATLTVLTCWMPSLVSALPLPPESSSSRKESNQDFEDKAADKVEEFVISIFQDSSSGGGSRGPALPPHASLLFQVVDNAGRPLDATIHLSGPDGNHTVPTTASRATFNATAPGRYTITVAPARGSAPAPRAVSVRLHYVYRITIQVRFEPPPSHSSATPRSSPPAVTTSPSLSSGTRLVAQGSVVDAIGRPADGTIYVYQGGREIGHVATVAGRFSLYDLARGAYELRVRASRSGILGPSTPFTVTPGLSRPTLRVP